MKKLGALLGFLGVALLGVGMYYKAVLSSGGYGSMSSTMILALSREMGMLQNLSTWDTIKMWCAENHIVCIGAGAVSLVLCIVINRFSDKHAYEKVLENSANVGTWRCTNCGEINKKNRATCAKCGTIAPKD